MRFTCNTCGQQHDGMPTVGWDYPIQYLDIPEDERSNRVRLTPDECVIDNEWYFVRGCLEVPVIGETDAFAWSVWVSLSKESYRIWRQYFDAEKRSNMGPFFGWLSSEIWIYPEACINLKTRVHLRDDRIRPFIELEPTDHPLAIEQRQGITVDRVIQIVGQVSHPES